MNKQIAPPPVSARMSAPPQARHPASPHTQKQSEVLAAIRSNLEESDVDHGIKACMLHLLDELDLHLGLATFACKRAALAAFASANLVVLFPVVGPLIETLGDQS